MSLEQKTPPYIAPNLDAWDGFMHDLRQENATILPDSEIRKRIKTIRAQTTSQSEKAVAYQQVVGSVIRIIPSILINSGVRFRIPPEELVGEAFETLHDSIQHRFDLSYGEGEDEKKSTFVNYYADSLKMKLLDPRTTVDLRIPVVFPRQVYKYRAAMTRAWRAFEREHNRHPSSEEWYEETEKYYTKPKNNEDTKETHAAIRQFTDLGSVVSLDKPYVKNDTDDEERFIPLIEAISDESKDELSTVLTADLRHEVMTIIDQLPGRDRKVVLARFGLSSEFPYPLNMEETGNLLSVSRERIRQIEAEILDTLRQNSILRQLAEEEGLPMTPPDFKKRHRRTKSELLNE